jgi:hypothetical protein
MKKFEKDQDFEINPNIFHTDVTFLDFECFLSDHLSKDHLEKCLKPPKLNQRSNSSDLNDRKEKRFKTYMQENELSHLELSRDTPPPKVSRSLM